MKKRLILPALLLALALALSACKPAEAPISIPTPTPEPSPSATPAPVAPPTAEVTPAPAKPLIWGDQTFARIFNAGDGTQVMQVSYTLPMVQNTEDSPGGKAISAWYKAEGASLLANAEENYEMAVADYDVSKSSGFPFQPTVEEMTFSVTTLPRCVSICREYYTSGGGASPMVFRFSEQFDPATGMQLRFADFFSDTEKVIEQVRQAFLALPALAEAIQSGALTGDQVSVAFQPENFYLTEDGYVFWIQGGDLPAIHSYIEVAISYDALKDVTADGR